MDFRSRYKYNPKEDLLGKGGFSRVFKAVDVLLDREVALKVFNSEQSAQYDLITEIKKVIKFHHENLCRYYDVAILETVTAFGEEEHVQVGVMEYLEGGELKKYLIRNPQYLDKLLTDVLKGLSYLHKKGIIHRDLKPQNILIKVEEDGPVAKITDFGISKALDTINDSNSALMGTVEYMAPEQFNPQKYGIDGQISTQLDLWSFGIMVFELIRGENLFGSRSAGTSAEVVMSNILGEDFHEKVKLLPAPYDEVVRLCVIKKASDRVKSADVLLDILQKINPEQRDAISLHSGRVINNFSDETIFLPGTNNVAVSNDETQVINYNPDAAQVDLSKPLFNQQELDATILLEVPQALKETPRQAEIAVPTPALPDRVPSAAPESVAFIPEEEKAVQPTEVKTVEAKEEVKKNEEKPKPVVETVKEKASEPELPVLAPPVKQAEEIPAPDTVEAAEVKAEVESVKEEVIAPAVPEQTVPENKTENSELVVEESPVEKIVEAEKASEIKAEEKTPVPAKVEARATAEKQEEVKAESAPEASKPADVKPAQEKSKDKQKPRKPEKVIEKTPVPSAKEEAKMVEPAGKAEPARTEKEATVSAPPKKQNNYLLAGIATAVVFAVIAFFLLTGKSSDNTTAVSASSASTASENAAVSADNAATAGTDKEVLAEVAPVSPSPASAASEDVSGKVFGAGASQYTYSGLIKNGKPDGKGTQTFSNGSVYKGSFANGKPTGKGSFVAADGSKYDLQFSNGKGVNAAGNLNDGSVYKGPFVLEGGSVYPNGKGSMTWADGDKYVGNWVKGKKTSGTFYYKDGALYKGTFSNDKREGRGKYMYADGSYYEGEFRNDDINGNGSRYNSSGELVESGTFKNGKLIK